MLRIRIPCYPGQDEIRLTESREHHAVNHVPQCQHSTGRSSVVSCQRIPSCVKSCDYQQTSYVLVSGHSTRCLQCSDEASLSARVDSLVPSMCVASSRQQKVGSAVS